MVTVSLLFFIKFKEIIDCLWLRLPSLLRLIAKFRFSLNTDLWTRNNISNQITRSVISYILHFITKNTSSVP